MTPTSIPSSVIRRLRRYLWRRTLWQLLHLLLLALGLTTLLVPATLGVDAGLLLAPTTRRLLLALCCLPGVASALVAIALLIRMRLSARELRALDSAGDDVRAALNLVPRLQAGDSGLNPALVTESVARAAAYAAAPLPSLAPLPRRLLTALLLLAVAAGALAVVWRHHPDLHTGLTRLLDVEADVGSIGRRKFPVSATVRENPTVQFAGDDQAPAEPRERTVYFLRERLANGAWQRNFAVTPLTLADTLAGYQRLAVQSRVLQVLEGDRVTFHFSALDLPLTAAATPTLQDVAMVRCEDEREVQLAAHEVGNEGFVVLSRAQRDHQFLIRSRGCTSPRYQVDVTARPTPDRIYLFQDPPSQYGVKTREVVIRDRARNLNLDRISGLPGSRLAIEFQTPYGEDLDPRESFAQIGPNLRLKLRYVTSRNPPRRAAGEHFWSFDFVLNESVPANSKLQLHLVTRDARFQGEPITNRYDEPLLVHLLEDLPPTVELVTLPSERHFATDEVFAFSYRYADDYGVAEVGLEVRDQRLDDPPGYEALPMRPAAEPGAVRTEDEQLQIVDLQQHRYGFLEFAVVVKDVKGQVAKTAPVLVTMSDHPAEVMLPRLTSGWRFSWSHAPDNYMGIPGDLETPPYMASLPGFAAGLRQLDAILAGTPPARPPAAALAELAKALSYRCDLFYLFGSAPFPFRHRDYPYYFARQAGLVLSAPALFPAAGPYQPIRDLLAKLAGAKDPYTAPEFAALQAWAPFVKDQLELAALVQDSRREIVLRAALTRAAHFSELTTARLAEVDRLMTRLHVDAGPAPAEYVTDDLWAYYPPWVQTHHPDYGLRQQALLVTLKLRNLNAKQAALHDELDRILGLFSNGLDPRLLAVMNMVARFGPSVIAVDRRELGTKTRLLARFIREGLLAAESGVYRELAQELPTCRAKATDAVRLLPEARAFAPAVEAVLDAAEQLAAAELPRHLGTPEFPAGRSARWRENQTSACRASLELVTRQAGLLLYGEELRECRDLAAVRARLLEWRSQLRELRPQLAAWPEVRRQEPLLTAADVAAARLLSVGATVAALERDLGILAGFAGVFGEGGMPELADRQLCQELGASLTTLTPDVTFAVNRRAALKERVAAQAALARARAVATPNPAEVTRLDQARQASVDAEDQRLVRLSANLSATEALFGRVISLVPAAAVPRVVATAPHPCISAHSSQLFDALAPEAVLVRLERDTQRLAGQPEQVAALYDAALAYFSNVALNTTKQDLGNVVEEYLCARAAAALWVTTPRLVMPFAETYSGPQNHRRPEVLRFFAGRDTPPGVNEFVAQQDYAQPSLPPELATLAAPAVEAWRAKTLAAQLLARRPERLRELLALCRRVHELHANYEILVRAHGLLVLLTEFRENLRLMRLPPNDIRYVQDWAEIQEQAEAWARDLLAGRLAAVPAPVRQQWQQLMPVFRRSSGSDALAAPDGHRDYLAGEAVLRQLRHDLLPTAAAARAALQDDFPLLQRDLAMVLLGGSQWHYWMQRQLEAEYVRRKILVGNIPLEVRLKQNLDLGPLPGPFELHKAMTLAAYAWRSVCVLRSLQFAAAPTDAGRQALLHDCARLLALKLMPEYYYDNFHGAIFRGGFAASRSPEAFVQNMAEQSKTGQKLEFLLIKYLLRPAPAAVPAIEDEEVQDLLTPLQISNLIFQHEVEFTAYQQRVGPLLDPATPAPALTRAIGAIRQAAASRGRFWHLLGSLLADALQTGEPFRDAETVLALPPARVRDLLQTQQAQLDQCAAAVAALGGDLTSRERNELGVLAELRTHVAAWRQALAAGDGSAASHLQAAYPDLHLAGVSYLQSIKGNMFPPDITYSPRIRYKHPLWHLEYGGFVNEMRATEDRWFRRADEALALVYEGALSHAADRLATGAPAADAAPWRPYGVTTADVAFAFHRFLDTRYRYLMAFSTAVPPVQRPPIPLRQFNDAMPEHLAKAFLHALTIDLPEQDNRQVRQTYFEALDQAKEDVGWKP